MDGLETPACKCAMKKPQNSESNGFTALSDASGSTYASIEAWRLCDVELRQRDVSHEVVFGLICYVLSTLLLMAMGSFAKLAEESGLPVMEIVLARSFALLVIPSATALFQRQNLRGNHIWLLAARGICGTVGISLWYLALKLLPLTDVVVFGFLTPLFVALASPLAVKEFPSRMVFTMAPVCLVGVILSVQPPCIFGGEQRLTTLGVVISVLQACVSAATKLVIRGLRTTDSPAVIILSAGLFATVISSTACILIPGQFVLPQSWQQIALLTGTGFIAYFFQLTMTLGLARVKAAPATTVSYLTIVWGIIAGYVVFGEVPNLVSLFGALIICVGTLAVVISDSWPRDHQPAHKHAYLRRRSLEKHGVLHGHSRHKESRHENDFEHAALLGDHRKVDLVKPTSGLVTGREVT